uniref:ribosomal protein S1 n=1 Tax=Grateloupia asiatica TaxID=151735 RepID=UPI002A82CE63|nr:ribosomal protein S1 [Grateloupia asiatica]WOL36817.1 ribosomal protein S1 [Grateloupia asiatica]
MTYRETIEERILSLINETREFFIVAYNKKSQQLLLSIKRLEYIRAWKRIKQIQTEDIIINAIVININKGGLLVAVEGLKSFIPNSHITTQEKEIIKIHQSIECKLLVADERRNQLICSNKCALLAKFANKFKIGYIVSGEVTEIKQYGLFITIHGIPALLHISEIGYKHIDNINKTFAVGNKIQVKIIHIDMKQGRLSVSTRDMS